MQLAGSGFFFASRRRHTRLTCDWSSDVCSSDLAQVLRADRAPLGLGLGRRRGQIEIVQRHLDRPPAAPPPAIDVEAGHDGRQPAALRSGERRVGKEWASRGRVDPAVELDATRRVGIFFCKQKTAYEIDM